MGPGHMVAFYMRVEGGLGIVFFDNFQIFQKILETLFWPEGAFNQQSVVTINIDQRPSGPEPKTKATESSAPSDGVDKTRSKMGYTAVVKNRKIVQIHIQKSDFTINLG